MGKTPREGGGCKAVWHVQQSKQGSRVVMLRNPLSRISAAERWVRSSVYAARDSRRPFFKHDDCKKRRAVHA